MVLYIINQFKKKRMNGKGQWKNFLFFCLFAILLTISSERAHSQRTDLPDNSQISSESPACQHGCKECDTEGLCLECVDIQNTKIEEHLCVCGQDENTFNIKGYCTKCYVDGCKYCESQNPVEEVTMRCAVCLDPEANIIDGLCVCPDHTYMVDGICEEDCPYNVVNGKCKKCELQGCKYCPFPPHCFDCKDPSAVQYYDSCACNNSSSMNFNEYCSQCSAPHCKVCQPGKRISTQCIQCIDPRATIVDGTCTCPTGQAFTSFSLCKQCSGTEMVMEGICVPRCQHTYGCSTCEDGICSACTDWSSSVEHNQCLCEYYGNRSSFDESGYCTSCRVPGCKACKAYQTYNCHECVDPTALTDDGSCICPEGKYMVDGICQDECLYFMIDGQCQKCKVEGCSKCPYDPEFCEECIDSRAYSALSQGRCGCYYDYQTLNIDGYCVTCKAFGCKICDKDVSGEYCAKCLDPTAVIVAGKCACTDGKVLNKEGICVSCSDPTEMVVDGVCVVKCEGRLGCTQCQNGVCLECAASSSNKYNECVCDKEGYVMTIENTCTQCLIFGCKTCSDRVETDETIQTCHECLDPTATITNGRCVCEEGKVLVDGYCQDSCPTSIIIGGVCKACQSIGCKQCSQSPDYCQKCVDQKTHISNGVCTCSSHEEDLQINEVGKCTYCHSPYCKYCEADADHSYRCIACTDPTAKIVNGVCTCPEGSGFDEHDFCRVCVQTEMVLDGACVPKCQTTYGCKTCTDGVCSECLVESVQIKRNQCDCGDGQLVRTDNQCGYCLIPGCKVCEALDDRSPCHACIDPSAQLVNGRCVCPDNQYLLQGICQDSCPYHSFAGQCRKCLAEGCMTCEKDPNYCTKCIDPNVYAFMGQCKKYYCQHQQMNEAGYCSDCKAVGCKTCEADGYESYRCFECVDPLASVQDGLCVCPDGTTVHAHKDGFCRQCSTQSEIVQAGLCVRHCEHSYGCSECSEGVCTSCLQTEDIAELRNNECVCIERRQAMTKSGVCSESRVPGCAVISEDNYYMCLECKDYDAILVNGKCLCPEGQQMINNGTCSTECPTEIVNGQCEVIKFEACWHYVHPVCYECSDIDTEMMSNRCVCKNHLMSPNEVGYCVFCLVPGCKACEATEPSSVSYRCAQCLDPDAVVQDGVCVCPTQNTVDGMCYRCLVPGCRECESAHSQTCQTCADPNASVNLDGQCECPEGSVMNDGSCQEKCPAPKFQFHGSCVTCLPGCANCQTDPKLCYSCDDGYYLEEKFCYQCPEGCLGCSSASVCGSCATNYEFSGQACVPKCNFPCLTCPTDAPDTCESCAEGYDPSGTTCTMSISCTDSNCVLCPDSDDVCERCVSGFEELRGECSQEGKFLFGGNQELSNLLDANPILKLRLFQTLSQRY